MPFLQPWPYTNIYLAKDSNSDKLVDVHFKLQALQSRIFPMREEFFRKVDENILGVNKFVIDSNTQKITSCPAGIKPISAKHDSEKEVYTAKFPKNICLNCRLLEGCPINKKQKKYNVIRFTEKKLQADRCRSEMNSDTFKMLADFRAGVEGVPSVLRMAYDLDKTW